MKKITIDAKVSVNGKKSIVKMDKPVEIYTKTGVDEKLKEPILKVIDNISANVTSEVTSTILSYGVNVVTTASGTDYAVKLPQPKTGKTVRVVNKSTRTISVFPSNIGGQINNLAIDSPAIVPNDGKVHEFICIKNPLPGAWVWTAPATNQIVIGEIEVNHTNGVATNLYGLSTANLGAQTAGVSNGNLALTGDWASENNATTVTRVKCYSNITGSDTASSSNSDKISSGLITAYLQAINSATFGQRSNEEFTTASMDIQYAPIGTINSPLEVGDSGTMFTFTDVLQNGLSDQIGIGGAFSRAYYTLGFFIPASAATKIYKFQYFLEVV